LQKKGATEGFPFDEYALVLKVNGQMFALIDLEGRNSIAMKCDRNMLWNFVKTTTALKEPAISIKKYWNRVYLNMAVDDNVIKHLIDHR
jgi:predicted DNA-binding protein (MmcQ/YjbR family)